MGYEKAKEKERDVSWLESFYDLVFVVAIAQLGPNLSQRKIIQYSIFHLKNNKKPIP